MSKKHPLQKKNAPAVTRQTAATRPNCPLCKKPMTAVSSSYVVTHYQCKHDECADKSVIPIPRPLERQKSWNETIAEHEAEARDEAPAIEDERPAHPDIAQGPYHGNANAKKPKQQPEHSGQAGSGPAE